MPIDFDLSDTAKVNAKLAGCAGCCPEPDCLLAEFTTQYRDSEVCKSGFTPYVKIPAVPPSDGFPGSPAVNPDAFDLDGTPGTLIPVYAKAKVYSKSIHNGSQSQTAKHYTDDVVDDTATQSFNIDQTIEGYVELIHQKRRDFHLASNVPLGICAPESSIVATASPSGCAAAVGTLAAGYDPIEGQTPVLLSWTDSRPELAESPVGHYEYLIDGGGGGEFVDDSSVQLFLADGDTSCHEFCVRHVISGGYGQWSAPVVFHLGENDCCEADAADQCGAFSIGNGQTSNPTDEGVSASQTYTGASGSVANYNGCDFLPDLPLDIPFSGLRWPFEGFFDYTTVVTASESKVIGTKTYGLATGAVTGASATGVTATGVTVDGFGNITGGTITGGTLGTGDVTAGGTITGGAIIGTLTGGTITGGTLVGGTLTDGTLAGASLSDGISGGAFSDEDAPETDGWKLTSDSRSGNIQTWNGSGAHGLSGAVLLSDDINVAGAPAVLFTELQTLISGYSATWSWGLAITLPAWPVAPAAGAARAVTYAPVIGNYVSSSIWARIRESRFQWTVQAGHVGTGFRVLWDVAFIPDAWRVWRGAKFAWATAQYAYLNRPMPGDPDYPVIGDFSEDPDPSAALAAAIDAIQKDPSVFPPAGWTLDDGLYVKGEESLTEEQLRDRYNLRPDPGSEPGGVTVLNSGSWTWASTQAVVPPETVSPCDPTYEARLPDPEPVAPGEGATPEEIAAYDLAHAAWEAAVEAAEERSTRTSPWFIITPDDLPETPGEFCLANVRHVCDLSNPQGILENYDHRFPTTELPAIDPAEIDPAEYADWY